MKKLGSIAVMLVMALGLTAFVAENTASEFEFMGDLSSMLACDNCSTGSTERDPPKTA